MLVLLKVFKLLFKYSITIANKKGEIESPYLCPLAATNGVVGSPLIITE